MQEPIKLYCPPTGNPPEELKVQMVELSKSCNLPLRFIDIIS